MRNVVAGLAMTLDGVVSDPSPWLMHSDELHEVIGEGIQKADAILLGRITYLEFAALWPTVGEGDPTADFMNKTPKYVVSSTLSEVTWENSTLLRGDLAEEVQRLKEQPGRDISIPGSPGLASDLLALGLLDELALLVHPLLLGSGQRLFEGLDRSPGLVLAESRALSNGVLALTYRATAT